MSLTSLAVFDEPMSGVEPKGFYQIPNWMAVKAIRAKLTSADWCIWSYLQMLDPYGDRLRDIPNLDEIGRIVGLSAKQVKRSFDKLGKLCFYKIELQLKGRNLAGKAVQNRTKLSQEQTPLDKVVSLGTKLSPQRQNCPTQDKFVPTETTLSKLEAETQSQSDFQNPNTNKTYSNHTYSSDPSEVRVYECESAICNLETQMGLTQAKEEITQSWITPEEENIAGDRSFQSSQICEQAIAPTNGKVKPAPEPSLITVVSKLMEVVRDLAHRNGTLKTENTANRQNLKGETEVLCGQANTATLTPSRSPEKKAMPVPLNKSDVQRFEARFHQPLHQWQKSNSRNDFNEEFVEYLKTYLSTVPSYRETKITPAIAKGWIARRMFDEKGLSEIEVQWEAFQTVTKSTVITNEQSLDYRLLYDECGRDYFELLKGAGSDDVEYERRRLWINKNITMNGAPASEPK